MDIMDTNMYPEVVDRFERLLEALRTDELGMDDITREVESVRQQAAAKKEKDEALDNLAGAWADDPEGEMMAEAIRTGRRSNTTRKLMPFDE